MKPLAGARGSDRSHDREGVILGSGLLCPLVLICACTLLAAAGCYLTCTNTTTSPPSPLGDERTSTPASGTFPSAFAKASTAPCVLAALLGMDAFTPRPRESGGGPWSAVTLHLASVKTPIIALTNPSLSSNTDAEVDRIPFNAPSIVSEPTSTCWPANGLRERTSICRLSPISRFARGPISKICSWSLRFLDLSCSCTSKALPASRLATPASLLAAPAVTWASLAFSRTSPTSLLFLLRRLAFLSADTTPTHNSPTIPTTTNATLAISNSNTEKLGLAGGTIIPRPQLCRSSKYSRIKKNISKIVKFGT